MKRLWFACLLFQAIAVPGLAALKEGDTAPDFTVKAARAGKTSDFSLSDALRRGPVVIYFFPAAFTAACNVQAHEFAVQHEKFTAAGATVVGVSLDDIDRLAEFSSDPDYCGGKVAMASDADGEIARAYDLRVVVAPPGSKDTHGNPVEHGLVENFTYVVGSDGKIAAAIDGPSPSSNVVRALEAVRKLAAKQMAAR